MRKYIIIATLLVANNEILSWLALCIIGAMFVWDMAGWTTEGKW